MKLACLVLLAFCIVPLSMAPLSKAQSPTADPAFLERLLVAADDTLLQQVMDDPERYQLQLIYTQIDRNADNEPSFTTYTYGVDADRYYYPASTVKMPAAVLALEKLNELSIVGLDRETPMYTGKAHASQSAVESDPSSVTSEPSVGHYVKKIFLVSDNDAFNRLYEFLGQEALNKRLHALGYDHTRIIHRLSEPGHTVESNRHTNPVRFSDRDDLLYYQGPVYSAFEADLDLRDEVRGVAYMDGGERVDEPFDFRTKNYAALHDLHDMLQAIVLPEAVPAERRFDLTEDDYRFLWTYMGMRPRESVAPAYPQYETWDSFVKFLAFGDSREPIPDHVRIFNKVGNAYGFLTDVAYVVDFEANVEFIVAASIHVNANETFNDNVYEYDTIGMPVLGRIGRLLLEHERNRERTFEPDLSRYDLY